MRIFLLVLGCFIISRGIAQTDTLRGHPQKSESIKTTYIQGTFKTTRLVIGQSSEIPPMGNALFLVSHHFGALNSGYQNLFGLKETATRIGAEYGALNWFGFGVGLNTYNNTWDGFVKFKILRQSKGKKKMPVTLSAFAGTAIYTTKWTDTERTNYASSRMSYAFQLELARKFGKWVSLQIMPSLVHKNLVATKDDHNDIFTLGAGGSFCVSQKVSFSLEYHHIFPGQVVSTKAYDSFSVGVDILTGGHVFQIFLTNSTPEFEEAILTETVDQWQTGGIFLGVNISRFFTLYYPKEHH